MGKIGGHQSIGQRVNKLKRDITAERIALAKQSIITISNGKYDYDSIKNKLNIPELNLVIIIETLSKDSFFDVFMGYWDKLSRILDADEITMLTRLGGKSRGAMGFVFSVKTFENKVNAILNAMNELTVEPYNYSRELIISELLRIDGVICLSNIIRHKDVILQNKINPNKAIAIFSLYYSHHTRMACTQGLKKIDENFFISRGIFTKFDNNIKDNLTILANTLLKEPIFSRRKRYLYKTHLIKLTPNKIFNQSSATYNSNYITNNLFSSMQFPVPSIQFAPQPIINEQTGALCIRASSPLIPDEDKAYIPLYNATPIAADSPMSAIEEFADLDAILQSDDNSDVLNSSSIKHDLNYEDKPSIDNSADSSRKHQIDSTDNIPSKIKLRRLL